MTLAVNLWFQKNKSPWYPYTKKRTKMRYFGLHFIKMTKLNIQLDTKNNPTCVILQSDKNGTVDTLDKLSASYYISQNYEDAFYFIVNTAEINFEVVFRNVTNYYTTTKPNVFEKLGIQTNRHHKRRL